MKMILVIAVLVTIIASTSQQLNAQKQYTIDISEVKPLPVKPLMTGGTNNKGDSLSANSEYIELNGKPFFPVMGEFHFSRYPHAYWEESILKIKAGGINVIATYVFWNLHEPKEGVFDWTGDRDLRKFIQLCNKHKIFVLVRVGPYGHGEIRNGAIPDWLYGMPVDIRTDNERYLHYVKKYYSEIGKQLNGLLFKDGGYVIGTQLENEYQHAGSTWTLNYPGAPLEYSFPFSQHSLTKANTWNLSFREKYKASGDAHMQTLKNIAMEVGLITPLYTATGWGYAAIVDKASLPVTAAYAYPSWGEQEPSPFYLFKDLKRSPDYGPVRYNGDDYPSLSAEMGSGIMVVYNKRPKVPAKSITPMMVRAIGSGSNGIGYYMYHGGSTPVQDGKFMSEELSGLPKISYDFQAPIGEYGQLRESYFDLIPLHLFLRNYGARLAQYGVTLPSTNPSVAVAADTLRYAVRSNGVSGFVFINNYQDHAQMKEQYFSLRVQAKNGLNADTSFRQAIDFKNIRVGAENWAIFPFNLELGKQLTIVSGRALPLGSYQHKTNTFHLFMKYEGITPELTINYKGKKYLINGNRTIDRQQFYFMSEADAKRLDENGEPGIMARQDSVETSEVMIQRPDSSHLVISMQPGAMDGLEDIFIRMNYIGDFGQAFLDGELIADHFYFGDSWEIGLKRFAKMMQAGKPLYIYFHPMKKDAPYLKYLEKVPDFRERENVLKVETEVIGVRSRPRSRD